jgi:hypothetical protein
MVRPAKLDPVVSFTRLRIPDRAQFVEHDVTRSICAPCRLSNEIEIEIAAEVGRCPARREPFELARSAPARLSASAEWYQVWQAAPRAGDRRSH